MILKNNADLAGGLILLVLGAATTAYTLVYYHLGTFSRMGPGMFPLILGVLIAVLGLLVLLPAIGRPVPMPQIRWRETVAVIVAILAFAALIEPAGFVPAIVALNFISALAESPFRLRRTAALAAGMSIAVFLLFRVALGLGIPAFRWGFDGIV